MSRRRRSAVAVALGLLLVVLLLPVALQAATDQGRAAARTTLAAQAPLLGNTFLLGVLQATATLLLAGRLALVATRRSRGRKVLHLACLAPLMMPPGTMALSLVVLLGHNGLLRRLAGAPGADGLGGRGPGAGWLPQVYGLGGMVVAGTLSLLPYAYLAMLAAERRVDQQLVETARALGLSAARARRSVVWPRLAPVAAATWLMVFAEAITDLANPLVLGGGYQVLATRVQLAVSAEYDLPAAAVAGLVLTVPTVLVFAAGGLLSARPTAFRSLAPAASAAQRAVERATGFDLAVGWLVGLTNLGLIGAVVGGAMVREIGVDASPTLAHLAEVLAGAHTAAFGYSLVLALLALPLTALVAVVLAVALRSPADEFRSSADERPWALRVARHLLGLLGSLPGVVVGLSLFLVLLRLSPGPAAGWLDPFGWGAVAAVVLVHVVRTLPGTVEPVLAAMEQQGRRLDEAALVLGARRRDRWLVAFPVVLQALLPALVAGFSRSLTAVSSVVLLSNSRVPLLSVRMLQESGSGRVGPACAMALCLASVVALAMLVSAPAARTARGAGSRDSGRAV